MIVTMIPTTRAATADEASTYKKATEPRDGKIYVFLCEDFR